MSRFKHLKSREVKCLQEVEANLPSVWQSAAPVAVRVAAAAALVVEEAAAGPHTLKQICLIKALQLLPDPPRPICFSSVYCDRMLDDECWQTYNEIFSNPMDLPLEDRFKIAAIFVCQERFHDLVMGPIRKTETRKQTEAFYNALAKETSLKDLRVKRTLEAGVTDMYPRATTAVLLGLRHFSQLTKLDIVTYSVKNDDIVLIATHLTELNHLSVILHPDVYKTSLEKLARLHALETFLFTSSKVQFSMTEYINFCLWKMPRLKVIGLLDDEFDGYHDFSHFQNPVNVGLARVQIKSDQIIPASVTLSQDTCLVINAENEDYLSCFAEQPLMPSVTGLVIKGFRTGDITQILQKHGGTLKNLVLKKTQPTSASICLSDILTWCPSLCKMNLDCPLLTMYNIFTPKAMDKMKGKVKLLEDLALNFSQDTATNLQLPGDFLTTLLLYAPMLQKVCIRGPRVDDTDLKSAMAVLSKNSKKEGEMRGEQLSFVEFQLHLFNDTATLGRFIAELVKACPKLKDVHIYNGRNIFFEEFLLSLEEIFVRKNISCLKIHPDK